MPPLPVLSGAELIAALRRIGNSPLRQRGSHVRLAAHGRAPVTVPLHAVLDRGTLRAILRTVEISVQEFMALLG